MLARDAASLLVAAVVLACLGAVIGPRGGFTVLRFLSQALFGEALLLAAALSALFLVRGFRAPGASLLVLSVLLIGVYVEAYHREPTDLQVRRHAVPLGRFPKRPLRLLHMSDMQTSEVGAYEAHVMQVAAEQRPDIIVLTGDFVQPRLHNTRARASTDLRPLLRTLAEAAPLGAYAVKGDVDVDWPRILDGTGIKPLSGESVRIAVPGGGTINLMGLTIGMSRGSEPAALERFVRRASASDVRIVLGHNPDFVIQLADQRLSVELALAGHTHGGQVALPFGGAPYTKSRLPMRYASGLHDYRGILLHISAGIGMERGAAPQIRFLCRPEICMLELH